MLAAREHDVKIWSRRPEVAEAINRDRRNPRYLSEFELPPRIEATASLQEAVSDAELVILAMPSPSLREVMREAGAWIEPGAIIVSAVKGIEFETGLTMHGVLEDVLDREHHARLVALSGPSFAREIANHQPTVVTLACREETYAISVQSTLSCPWFRSYTQSDIMGVEIAGALKNVIAIAIGICDGMQSGDNARAALMTRGLAEITRIGVAQGAEPATFLGLSGIGDLLLTCTGNQSRNRRVGLALGTGRALDEILAELGEVAEGIQTTRAACRLAARLGVDAPISNQVRAVIDGEQTPAEAGRWLMARQLKSERERSHRSEHVPK
jgi:glycerol-3-phosphate dehydrogenase (NAD(P)+)